MQNKNINLVIANMHRSGIRRIMDRALELDPKQKEIIHLEVGQPQEPTSEVICKAVSRAALNGHTKYTQNAGFQDLRKAIKDKLQKSGTHVTEDNIFVTPGATFGASIAIGTLINNGDEVLIPDPGYPNFSAAVRHYGGIVKYYTLKEENDFRLDFDDLVSLISNKTKLLIINSPSNPTGTVLSEHEIEKLIDLTYKNNIWLLSDEVYEAFVYSGKHISPLSFPNSDHVVGVYSFSKSYNMAGLRVGYIVSRNKPLCDAFLKAQELYISCAPSTSQLAAIDALKLCDGEIISLKSKFKAKLDLALNILGDYIKYTPAGAFYLLINISETGLTSNEFADFLLETEKVAVAPGVTFGPSSDKYIRIALTAEVGRFETGLKKIKNFLLQYKRQ